MVTGGMVAAHQVLEEVDADLAQKVVDEFGWVC
jgi:hypothetical protein